MFELLICSQTVVNIRSANIFIHNSSLARTKSLFYTSCMAIGTSHNLRQSRVRRVICFERKATFRCSVIYMKL